MEAHLAGVKKGTPGLTRVIASASGAGKTSLLGELEARFRESENARPVYMGPIPFRIPQM